MYTRIYRCLYWRMYMYIKQREYFFHTDHFEMDIGAFDIFIHFVDNILIHQRY